MEVKDFIKKLRQIEFYSQIHSQQAVAGSYHSAFKGQGMTFSECKAYEEGDDVRYIDWHSSARQSGLFVKQFIEERELNVSVILDLSPPMKFGSVRQKKFETAIEAMSILAFSALRNNDRVSVFLFDERGMKYIPPLKGKGNTVRFISEALSFRPSSEANTLRTVFQKAISLLKRRSLVFIISDFLHADYDLPLSHLSHRHDVLPVVVSDPMESDMPDMGLSFLRDISTGYTILTDTSQRSFRTSYRAQFKARLQAQDTIFSRVHLTPVRISTTEDIVRPILRAFHRRSNHVAQR